jgi:hypothetical protein
MKFRHYLLPAAALVATVALGATTYTTNYNLGKPGDGDSNYGETIRDNFDAIDSQMKLNADGTSAHVSDTTSAHVASSIGATAGSTLCTSADDVQEFLECLDDATATFVSTTSTSTLTNKTLTAPVIDSAEVNDPAILGGTIDSAAIGAGTPDTGAFTTLSASSLTATTAAISAGTVDNATVGATTPAAGTFTTATANTSLRVLEGGGSPTYFTTFQGGDQSGAVVYTLPVDDGGANQVLQTDGAGVLSWVNSSSGGDVVGPGTSVDGEMVLFDATTGALLKRATGTGVVHSTSGVFSTSIVTVAEGGTNKALTLSAGGIPWVDADSFEVLAAGTSGQILTSGGASTPTWTTLVPLANGGTNKAMTAAAGGVVWTDADSQEVTAAGTSGQHLVSSGTGAPSWTGLLDGRVWVGSASNLPSAVVPTGDVTISNTGVTAIGASKVTSSMILDGEIVNADVSGSAAIDGTKIVEGTKTARGTVKYEAGTYAPTLTITSGTCTVNTVSEASYLYIGGVVSVTGYWTFNCSAGTIVGTITLPPDFDDVDFTQNHSVQGVCSGGAAAGHHCSRVEADTTGDLAEIVFVSAGTGGNNSGFHFTYTYD